MKLFFHNTFDLQVIRRELLPLAKTNSAKFTAVDAYADIVGAEANQSSGLGGMGGLGEDGDGERAWGAEEDAKKRRDREPSQCIIDIREHDIAYYLRVAIDLGSYLSSGASRLVADILQMFESVCGTRSIRKPEQSR